MLLILLSLIFSLVSSSDWVRTEPKDRFYHKNLDVTATMEYDIHIVMKQTPPGDQSGSCVQLTLGHSKKQECGIGVCFTVENEGKTKIQLLKGGSVDPSYSHKGKLENVKFTLTRSVTLMTVGQKTVFLRKCSLNEMNYMEKSLEISLGFQQKTEGNVTEGSESPWWHTFQLVEIKKVDKRTQKELEKILNNVKKGERHIFYTVFRTLTIFVAVFAVLTATGTILAILSIVLVLVYIQKLKKEDDEEIMMDAQIHQEIMALEALVKGTAKNNKTQYQTATPSAATTLMKT